MSYQWQRDEVAIAGATTTNYQIGNADVGHRITVVATYTDGQGTVESVSSAAIVPNRAPVDTTTPSTDPAIGDPDPIGEVTPGVPDLELDYFTEDPQGFEEILVDSYDESVIELTEDNRKSVEELRSGSQHERPENDRSYSYFDNNLYKELLSAQHLDFQAREDTLNLDEFDDFGTIDFESDNLDEIIAKGDYDLLRQEIDEAFNQQVQADAMRTKIATMATATFTIGIISYLLRAGSFAAALASSLPLWRGFDPIIVFSGNKKKKKDQNELPDTDELKPESLFEDEAE
ncbi:MAG: hypothetical protein GQ563_06730 [Desulfuromusa sp.]|nr:hypothetical protein [Desulfuromusa sp.]